MSKYSLKTICSELGDFFASPELQERPVTDALNVSALLLENKDKKWCLVSVDITELDTYDTSMLRKKAAEVLGMDYRDLWIAFSHTHSAVWGKGRFDVEKFSACILNVLEELKNTSPQPVDSVALVSVDTGNSYAVNRRAYVDGIGSFSAYQCSGCSDDGKQINAAEWVRNELVKSGADVSEAAKITQAYLDGPVDGILQLLLFGFHGKAAAGIVRFNAHSVILSSGFYMPHFSRDYCGMLVDNLVKMWDCPIFFIQGPAGNQRTRHTENTPAHCTEFAKRLSSELNPGKTRLQWEPLDELMAANHILKCRIHDWLALSHDAIEQRMVQLHIKLKTLNKDTQYLAKFKKLSDELNILKSVDELRDFMLYMKNVNLESGFLDFEVSAVKFGPMILIGTNGEVGNFLSLNLYKDFGFENLIVAAYTNGSDGYLLEKDDFERGGYEPAASIIAPENTEKIMKMASELIITLNNVLTKP